VLELVSLSVVTAPVMILLALLERLTLPVPLRATLPLISNSAEPAPPKRLIKGSSTAAFYVLWYRGRGFHILCNDRTRTPFSFLLLPRRAFFVPVTLVVESASPPTAHLDVKTAYNLGACRLNLMCNVSISATGGTPPYNWSLAGGAVPSGISLSQMGQLSGIPAQVDTFSFSATVTDSAGWTTTRMFTLTVRDPSSLAPVVNQGGVVNAATQLRPVSPGSIVSIYGTNLSDGTYSASRTPLPTTLGNVEVTFDGTAAPLLYVSSTQINAQMPWTGQNYTVNVVVTSNGIPSDPQEVWVESFAPGIFQLPPAKQAAALNLDGTVTAAKGSIPGVASHPAKPGDIIQIWATGFGPVAPTCPTGQACGANLSYTIVLPIVLIGNVPASVTFSGLSPQFVGINQFNVTIPKGVASGDGVALTVSAAGQIRSTVATIAVSN
jgi:uncharacterized protein (TIGR03437 family)